MRTFYLQTYGCQMNEADSEEIRKLLTSKGMVEVQDYIQADLVLVNTCVVRRKAELKAYSFLGELKGWKQGDGKRKLVLMGCLAARAPQYLQKRFTFLDAIIPGKDVEQMKQEVLRLLPPEDLELLPHLNDTLTTGRRNGHIPVTGMISVIRGCNHTCSFCIVPYVRGRGKSTPLEEVLSQAKNLMATGVKEILLLGQSILSYGKDLSPPTDLQSLLYLVHEKCPEIARIRFITSHPGDVTLEFVRAVKELPRVMEYFHIPFQAGSNRILQLMRRGITIEEYEEKVALIREEIPNAGLSTDIIVGFPGETEEDFEKTLKVVEKIQFDSAFCFEYSPRERTLSALKWGDPVPKTVKQQRFSRLFSRVKEIVYQRNQAWVGKIGEVLVEGKQDGTLYGRLRDYRMVHLQGDESLIGQVLPVHILKAGCWTLTGEIQKPVVS